MSESRRPPRDVVGTVLDSPLGPLSVYADAVGLCGLYLDGHRPAPAEALRAAPHDPPRFTEVAAQLEQYFAGTRLAFELPLSLHGTAFQRDVWTALGGLAMGETTTYAALARRVGRPAAVRAVGAANARNPISIVVPCHRVVGHDGALVGYAGGLERKRFLLEHERRLRGSL